MQRFPSMLSAVSRWWRLARIVASVYDFVYVAPAKAGDRQNKLRQTETRNMWFGYNLPELWAS